MRTASGSLEIHPITRRRLLAGSLGLTASTLLLSSCSALDRRLAPTSLAPPAGATPSAGPRTGGMLRISQTTDIVPMGAPNRLSGANVHLLTLVYDTLVSYDANLTPRPRLATGWQWSPDFRRLTLTLRHGVTFHSGRAVTSDDVRLNLESLRDPALGSIWRNYANLMTISTPDPATLVVDFERPVKASFDVLAGTFIADPQATDDTNAGRGFVGTGPFRFQEWVSGNHLTVTRNPAYWQPGKPYLDQVELQVIPDPFFALAALRTGRIDWISGVAGQDALRLQGDPSYQLILMNVGDSFYYVGFDLSVAALADRRVRQAFNYALNRQAMVDSALYGFARPATIPWPRQSPGYDAVQDQTYPYDLAKAQQLLQAAGWDPNTTVPMLVPSTAPATVTMAQIYQADLAKVGVSLAVQQIESADFGTRLVNGRFGGTWMAGMGFMNLSPATFLTSAFTVRIPNASHFESPRYQALIDQVTAETDDQKLKALVHDVTQIILDESFVIPIAEDVGRDAGPEATRRAVQDAAWDAFGLFGYEDIWLQQ
jgi:peptide/nickel transport system substrate-binding protein